MRIDLEEGTQVISQKPYRVPDRLREGVKWEIDILLESRVIDPSDNVWSLPCVPVIKPDGRICLCIDYRKLNAVTPQLQQWISTLDEVLEKAGKATVLSKLDLVKGYYQVQMETQSKDLTTFIHFTLGQILV